MTFFRKYLTHIIMSAVIFLSIMNLSYAQAEIKQKADEHYKKGLLLYHDGEYEKAQAEFLKAKKLIDKVKKQKVDPKKTMAVVNEHYQKGLTEHYKKGLLLYHDGEYEKAQAEFLKAKKLIAEVKKQKADPEKTKAVANEHYQKGLTLYYQGEYEKAKEEFLKAKVLAGASVHKEQTVISKEVKPEKKKKSFEYIIGEGDVLAVSVWENDDLDAEVMVRPDGKVSFALVGDVLAVGFTIEQFRQDLTALLKEYIRYPQVSVSIKVVGGEKVIVLGHVRSPGVYEITGRKTILEAIGKAGGFTRDAVLKSIIVVKGGLETPVPKKLNLTRALKKGEVIENIVLESEDIIYVPSRVIADVSYFMRTILSPITQSVSTTQDINDIRDWNN
ncbi:MAG: hypothetical protein GY853_03260 [PVC group bacterium]|nr:hypothetical protein [PVC group bacterium]